MAVLVRVSILGQMPSGEVWSVNPVYRLGTGLDVPATATQLQAIVAAINAIAVPTGLLQAMSSSTNVSGCRVEARSMDGTLDAIAEGARAVPAVGTGLAPHPFQTSLVLSLRTTTPGPSGRGRLYWPGTGVNIAAATLRLNSGVPASVLSGAKTFLSAIETAVETTLGPASLAVWSRTTSSIHAVSSLQLGDVADTQRRRRDTLIEAVSVLPYP